MKIRTWAVVAVVAVVAVGAGVYSTQSGSAAAKPLIVTAEVSRRTIQDQLTLTGTLSRLVQRTVTASTSGEVTQVAANDGDTISVGQSILSLNGRAMVAEPGDFPFFRSLTVGDSGQDVQLLDEILSGSGFDPGPIGTAFTTQTEAALLQWQTAHGYPGVAANKSETLGLSLEPSSAYTVGPEGAAGFTIDSSSGSGSGGSSAASLAAGAAAGAGGAGASGSRSGSGSAAQAAATRPGPGSEPTAVLDSASVTTSTTTAPVPTLTIYAANTVTNKGAPAMFLVYSSATSTTPITFNVAEGGNAPGDEVLPPAGPFTLAPGSRSVEVQVPTRLNGLVQPNTVVSLQLQAGTGYQVGDPGSAETTIQSSDLPKLTVSGGGTIAAGAAATFTITADQPPVQNTTVAFQLSGSAQAGQDYQPGANTVLLPAGATRVTVTVDTMNGGVVFQPTDMITGAWPIRVGQVSVKEGDSVGPGSDLFTLTDSNFTVTLSASPSNRTQLKVGQSVTVQLQGGSAQATGVISQLDSYVTVNQQTNAQTYQGKISVGDLGAADGATVTIDVDVNAASSVVAVPIAAVEQNGSGQDVVRVIDLSRGGRVTDVPVQTGISDSSYIQIERGLSVGQVVIVDEIPG